jgi:hypothetical protein
VKRRVHLRRVLCICLLLGACSATEKSPHGGKLTSPSASSSATRDFSRLDVTVGPLALTADHVIIGGPRSLVVFGRRDGSRQLVTLPPKWSVANIVSGRETAVITLIRPGKGCANCFDWSIRSVALETLQVRVLAESETSVSPDSLPAPATDGADVVWQELRSGRVFTLSRPLTSGPQRVLTTAALSDVIQVAHGQVYIDDARTGLIFSLTGGTLRRIGKGALFSVGPSDGAVFALRRVRNTVQLARIAPSPAKVVATRDDIYRVFAVSADLCLFESPLGLEVWRAGSTHILEKSYSPLAGVAVFATSFAVIRDDKPGHAQLVVRAVS